MTFFVSFNICTHIWGKVLGSGEDWANRAFFSYYTNMYTLDLYSIVDVLGVEGRKPEVKGKRHCSYYLKLSTKGPGAQLTDTAVGDTLPELLHSKGQ
jgi:hypothetical protein